MSTLTKTVNNALVYYDSTYPNRWYDAYGPDVVKYLQEWVSLPVDAATGDPIEWEVSVTEAGAGTSTCYLTDGAGGVMCITTAGDTDDGYQMQLAGATGESVRLDGDYQTYFGCKVALDDATEMDLLVGLCVDDADCLGGVTDGVYFRKVDGSTTCYFVTEKDSAETTTAAVTMANGTGVILEFYFNGRDVLAYANGILVHTTAWGHANLATDEDMRLTIEVLTGEDVANTAHFWWTRLIHLRG